jgi:hypothetical protein
MTNCDIADWMQLPKSGPTGIESLRTLPGGGRLSLPD